MRTRLNQKQTDLILQRTRAWLENRGIDTQSLADRAEALRKERRQFSTPLKEGVGSRFKTIPPGNQEFRPVGVGLQGIAPRCQARSRASGWRQCNAVAVSGFRVCRAHGASAHGSKTREGIQRSAAHLTVHGKETTEIRRRRSEASKVRKRAKRQLMS